MKNNYQIKIKEQSGLPDERINRHKDFNRVLANYEQVTTPLYNKPLYKNPRAFLGLLLILIMAWLVWLAVEEERKKPESGGADKVENPEPRRRLLSPLSLGIDLAYADNEIPADEQVELSLLNGGSLEVPVNSFVDHTGKPVWEDVHLKLRQFADPVEMALLGIHLGVDSPAPGFLEVKYMLEIKPESQGVDLMIEAGKDLRYFHPALNELDETNALYYFDAKLRGWVHIPNGMQEEKMEKPQPQDDGFKVIDLDKGPASTPKAQQGFSIRRSLLFSQSGLYLVGKPVLPRNELIRAKIRLVGPEGQTVRCGSLHLLPKYINSYSLFWAQDELFTYDLVWEENVEFLLLGTTEEGGLVIVDHEALATVQTGKEEVQDVRTRLFPQAPDNLPALKELLGFAPDAIP